MLTPRRLVRGDTVAAVTLSWGGPGTFPHRYAAGKRQLEETFGLHVVEMPHTLADPASVAADPQARADDLHAAFSDPAIAGIISTIGGDDSIRLLPLLDLDLIRANPKVLLGYSDTTITQMACLRAGLVTFYGPSIMTGFAENGGAHGYMRAGVERMLFSDDFPCDWPANAEGWTDEELDWADPSNQQRRRVLRPTGGWRWLGAERAVEGRLLPVCMEVVDWLRGTPWWPDMDGAVLAFETTEEAPPPDAVARFLRCLDAMGDLRRLAGLLFARPGGGIPPERHAEYDDAILQVVEREAGLSLPVVTNLDFGHTDPFWTLPIGTTVRVDPGEQRITFTERPTS